MTQMPFSLRLGVRWPRRLYLEPLERPGLKRQLI